MQDIIDSLIRRQRQRTQWVRARTRLTNQIKAVERALKESEDEGIAFFVAATTEPLAAARAQLDLPIKRIEKEMTDLAKHLPVSEWWCSFRGMNLLGLAQVVGEACDIGKYRSPAALWKRFALHVMSGKAARPKPGVQADFSMRRRSVIKVIGTSVKMGAMEGGYRDIYNEAKARYVARNEAGEFAERAAADLKAGRYDKKTEAYKHVTAGKIPPGHVDSMAMRYMEKRILRDLWRVWRGGEPEEASVTDAA